MMPCSENMKCKNLVHQNRNMLQWNGTSAQNILQNPKMWNGHFTRVVGVVHGRLRRFSKLFATDDLK